MRPGDPHDPLLRQVLPLVEESHRVPGYVDDPLRETAARAAPGLLQKYRGRALLLATAACAVHCRYCFRREYPYAREAEDGGRWQAALAHLASEPGITELILSGGDPLTLSDARLHALTQALALQVPQLQTLRIHTRLPIVLPARVDAGLLGWLRELPWQRVVVVHANHAQEIDAEVARGLLALRATGATVLNQSVLLAGVNDSAAALVDLSRALHQAGALPYYLHLTDPVTGTAHFAVDAATGCRLVDAMARELPGYLVPRLVREEGGREAKSVVAAGLSVRATSFM
jgi:EF-P beta-lysylation protein EpmB